ncbi:MAG: DUF2817 domain-containing protein, partial [Actinobacteria bacterium]|nr:DUF2817 domain-containing protein [Actinomycetota bacterium]
DLYIDKPLHIAGYPILARSLCVSPKQLPIPGQTMHGNVALPGVGVLQKRISVEVPDYPLPEPMNFTQPVESVSVQDELELRFAQQDRVFEYYMIGNNAQQPCDKFNIVLRCSLTGLNLLQSKEYQVEILRAFNGRIVGEVQRRSIKTFDPLEITDQSIEQNELVYARPGEITISFNKQLKPETLVSTLKTEAGEAIAYKASVESNTLQILFDEALAREETYTLSLDYMEAIDNSILAQPWTLSFTTSGGPAVERLNIAEDKIAFNHEFRITFDQALRDDQALDDIVSLSIDGSPVENQAKVEDNQIIISPTTDLVRCETYGLSIVGELDSEHAVQSSVTWRTTARTTCKQSKTIGFSVEGRPINAYIFGDGAKKILYVGGMHGNEYSSILLMEAWVRELDNRFHEIPDDHTVIVIPNSSPDGTVIRSRLNANNVDLNRNFPTDDWQSEVQIPGPTVLPKGGGKAALSEPESQALATFVRTQRPKLVLTYHAVASVVIGNDIDQANAYAQEYAQQAGYDFSTNDKLDEVFNYDATGAFEDWFNDELSTPAILVEMATMSGDEMSRNRDALWRTLNIF